MNLKPLFEAQRVLDERIIKEKELEGQDLLPNKILALHVELGECANEYRAWKFWSNDQLPKNYCMTCQITSVPHECKNPLLEEFVDCLHFILSIGLDLVHREQPHIMNDEEFDKYAIRQDNVTGQFLAVMSDFSELWEYGEIDYPYSVVITRFYHLGQMLGFTWEEIEQAYFEKNQVNHLRQEQGY